MTGGSTTVKGGLIGRLTALERQSTPAGRVRLCWRGSEPDDLGPNDTLYRLSWSDEVGTDDDA
ncbi:hypothetical protein [Sphingomonas paucimobilis]|uniref:Uncharacterized protein n=1 Tax=Sphingomonas paucimobilis TaxID=13689 RepID=A0A7Y2PED0_SPHPI|nr:hypothetical protein [Sphingomonas paucimobilis]NNG59781.1 hypothetical protein [Sphingomonas paucimobilis]